MVGSQARIEIHSADVWWNPQFSWSWRSNNRETSYAERRDWDIENLDEVVESGNYDLIRMLWQAVVGAKAPKADAVYRANASAPRYRIESQLVQNSRRCVGCSTGTAICGSPKR